MPQPICVGLVGFGLSGRYFHAPFLASNPNFQLTHVVERHRTDAPAFDPLLRTVRSLDALLAEPAIELVILSTPNHTHRPYAEAALRAGKHVLIEKPFTTTVADAAHLLDLAQQRGLVCLPYQNRRYDADFLTIRQLLREGRLGAVNTFEGYFDRYRPQVLDTWKEHDADGGGNLYNLGPHLIDQALVLFGPPQAVWADIRRLRQGGSQDDYFDLVLYYVDTRVRLRSNMVAPANRLRYVIHGADGSFVKSGLDVQEETLRGGALPNGVNWGREPASQYGTLTNAAGERHVVESLPGNYHPFYDNLARAIRGEAAPDVTPEQTLTQLHILERAQESSRTGRVLPLT